MVRCDIYMNSRQCDKETRAYIEIVGTFVMKGIVPGLTPMLLCSLIHLTLIMLHLCPAKGT